MACFLFRKSFLVSALIMVQTLFTYAQNNIGIGITNPNSKAILDISSTTRGLLIPRMSMTQRDAITGPPRGLLTFVNTDSSFYYFDGSKWTNLSIPNRIADADGNTGIFAEKFANEDQLRFNISGAEYMRLVRNSSGFTRLELLDANSSSSLGIGRGALGKFDGAAIAENTVVGINAGLEINSGQENSFFGSRAGVNTSSGTGNTFVGRSAGRDNQIGEQNTFIGKTAGRNVLGSENVLVGSESGQDIVNGNQNTAVGSLAGSFYDGNLNTFLGYYAHPLEANLTNATSIGAYAFVGCSNCMALGPEGENMVNVGIGTSKPFFKLDIRDNGTASDSAFISVGQKDLSTYLRLSGGSQSTPDPYILFTGERSLRFITDDGGYKERLTIAPNGNINITNNLGIGRTPTATYPLEIKGRGAGSELVKFFNTANAEKWHLNILSTGSLNFVESGVADNRMVLGTGGEVGVGKIPLTSVNDSRLVVKQKSTQNGFGIEAAGSNNHWDFWVDGGNNLNVYYNGTPKGVFSVGNGAYTQASDRRLKKDITTHAPVLDKITQLEAFNYHYTDNDKNAPLSTGFMAQDVQKLFPDAVSNIEMKNGETMLGINYQYFTVAAIKGLQEQQIKITTLEERIAKLEAIIKTVVEKK